jgi:hypothetical protein
MIRYARLAIQSSVKHKEGQSQQADGNMPCRSAIPGADVAGVSAVPVQNVAAMSPVPVQMWQG